MTTGTAESVGLAIAARLATITVAGGFETDVGARVYRGRRRIDPAQVPCVVMVEAEDKVLDHNAKSVRLHQRYIVEAHAACDPDHPNDAAHKMLRDIKRAVFTADKTLGGVARDIFSAGRGIAGRDDGLSIVSAIVEVDVEYIENLHAP
jgi:hypothetical protein